MARPADLSELRNAPGRRAGMGSVVGARPWNGSSAYAEPTLRRAAGLRRGEALAERVVERARARMGAHQDGGAFGAGRYGQAHVTQAWLAVSDDPFARSAALFLPPAASGAEPDRARCEGPGSAHLRMRPDFRRRAPRVRKLDASAADQGGRRHDLPTPHSLGSAAAARGWRQSCLRSCCVNHS